jgi:hypothetical protein
VIPPPLLRNLHRATSGLRDSADHFVSFFIGVHGHAWARGGVRLAVLSKDDALENAVLLFRAQCGGRGRFVSPSSVATARDLERVLAE